MIQNLRVAVYIIVTDGGVGECVDPEGNGVNPEEGDGGGPAHLARSKISS